MPDCQPAHYDYDFELDDDVDATIDFSYDGGGHELEVTIDVEPPGRSSQDTYVYDGGRLIMQDHVDSDFSEYRIMFTYDCPDGPPPH